MMTPDILADVTVNVVGMTGVGYYLWHLHKTRARSPIESRLLFLFWVIFAVLFVRSFFWSTGEPPWLQKWVFFPAVLLPLASVFVIEGLLRRHVPKAIKIITVAGVLCFSARNLLAGISGDWLVAFLAFFAAILFIGVVLLFMRDRKSLSAAENRLISAFTVAAACSVPLVASDFRLEIGMFPIRLGAFGALLMVYVFVRDTRRDDSPWIVLNELRTLCLRGALVATLIVVLLKGRAPLQWDYVFFAIGAASAFVLQLMIFDRISSLSRQNSRQSVTTWLLSAPTSSKEAFLAALNRLPQLGGLRVLESDMLQKYDAKVLGSFLSEARVVGLAQLRRQQADGHTGREQTKDLLETHHMTHACLLQADPLVVMLCTLPEVEQAAFGESELRLIQRLGSLVLSKAGA